MAAPPIPDGNDIFISYTHIDDEPLAEGLSPWVTELDKRLRVRLRQLLGAEVRVWRDPEIRGTDYFDDALRLKIGQTCLLLSVLSPRYIKSEWCLRELEEFCQLAGGEAGLRAGHRWRVVKVLKTHVALDKHPPQIRDMLGYEFYKYDESSRRVREFSPETKPHRDEHYWEKFEDLAQDIADVLDRVRGAARASSGKVVYLAETSSDLSVERDRVRRELELRGHEVLPAERLPTEAGALAEEVLRCLGRSHLAVHLIGSNYGLVPENESRSVVHLQHELAAEAETPLPRIVWLPEDLRPTDERQRGFVEGLKQRNVRGDVELLACKLEDLKLQVQKALARLDEPPAPAPAPGGDEAPPIVYLAHHQEDSEAVLPLTKYLQGRGLEVISPLDTDAVPHTEQLSLCDLVIVYFDRAPAQWLSAMKMALLKMAGLGRERPPVAPHTFYLPGEQTQVKELFMMQKALIVRGGEGGGGPVPREIADMLSGLKGVTS